MPDQVVMQLFELCGHVLDNRERLILSNLLLHYRTPQQLSEFLQIPKFIVVKTGKYALQKLRDECIKQLEEAGAPKDLIDTTVGRLTR